MNKIALRVVSVYMIRQLNERSIMVMSYFKNIHMYDFTYLCKIKRENGISHLVSELGVP